MANRALYEQYEAQLLGKIIYNKNIFYENSDVIVEDLFYYHRDVFIAYSDAISQGKHPSMHLILAKMPDKKIVIRSMVKNIDHGIPVEDLFTELSEAQRLRHIDGCILEASSLKTSDDKIAAITKAVTNISKAERSNFEKGYDAAKKAILSIEKNVQTGIPTGFSGYDDHAGGLQKTDLVIIAAESSVGKTSLALNITDNVLDGGRSVCFISLEMSNDQIMSRMVSSRAGVPVKELRSNFEVAMSAASEYEDKHLYIADVSDNRSAHITGLIRGAVLRHGVDVAVVDYLQLIQGSDKGQNREQEVGQIARGFKNLAKELGITVIVLSQLNRPKQGNGHYPTMSRLRDSGQIEEAADVIWFIYRPEQHGIREDEGGNSTEGVAYMIIAKGRNYGTTQFTTQFIGKLTKFVDPGHTGGYGGIEPNERFEDGKLPF